MRLVFVNSAWAASWGGGEKWTVEAAAWFSEHGDDVLVIGRPKSRVTQAASARNLQAEETPFGGDFDPLAVNRARKLLRDFRADLVMVNFNKEAWQFGLAAKLLRIPIVARHGFPLLSNKIHHQLLLQAVFDKLVVNATEIRADYEKLGLPVAGIDVIHNGTRILPPKPGELRKRFDISDSRRIVLGAGRLESQKRFDVFIEVAGSLLASHSNLIFLIAGEGPLQSDLQAKIGSRGLIEKIRLIGFVPDFAEVVCDADLFLLTSDQEGTPNVLLEAMAAGVPCLKLWSRIRSGDYDRPALRNVH